MTIHDPIVHSEALARLAAARAVSDDLFRTVHPEALYDRPIDERHRIIFYVGHIEAFDRNLLSTSLFDLPSFNRSFDKLFAFGIDPLGGGLPTDHAADWPLVEDVNFYVRQSRSAIDRALATGAVVESATTESVDQILNVAIEHRLMHAETLAYMFHRLPRSSKRSAPLESDPVFDAPSHRSVDIPAGTATLGRSLGFGWDNEFPEHLVSVPGFQIDRYKVTNGQFLKFVEAGAYSSPAFWSEADWEWRSASGIEHPGFWTFREGQWHLRGMFGDRPLPIHWPVFVSQAEASAYAKWLGKALPTEAQFHRAAYGHPDNREQSYPWGDERPTAHHGNFDFRRWDPTPVNAHPAGDSAFGVADVVGNGWEWTSTTFGPFEGFHAFPFYPGYSADFFDGRHFVIKGGSMRTAACFLRGSFRNWFQGHYPYVYAGFRCVMN